MCHGKPGRSKNALKMASIGGRCQTFRRVAYSETPSSRPDLHPFWVALQAPNTPFVWVFVENPRVYNRLVLG